MSQSKVCAIPLADMLDPKKRTGSMFDLCECGLTKSECSWNKLPPRPDGVVDPYPFAPFRGAR